MPPVWNQRTPSSPKIFSQLNSPGLICDAAEWPRSEQPSAGRMPKPFSVKLRPTRVLRPRPSKSRQITCDMSTPPCMMRSSTSQPRSFFGSAVTTAARLPQHLRIARATLYSPPPSHTWKLRELRTRPKPGSKRSITSPKDDAVPPGLGDGLDLQDVVGHGVHLPRILRMSAMRGADVGLDAGVVGLVEQRLGDEVRPHPDARDAGA